MRIFRFLLVSACVASWAASLAYAIDIDREYHETFAAEPGMRLHLEHGDGDVSITPWDRDAVDIHVRYVGSVTKVGIGKVNADFRAVFDVNGKTIYAKGKEPGGSIMFGFLSEHELEYRWTIKAPAYLLLEIKGDDGDVEISHWQADIHTFLEDGDYSLTDIRGDVRIKLDDGDVRLDGFEGKLSIQGEDGDIVVHDCKSQDARIDCDDGRIMIDRAAGNFDIATEDGDIELDRVTLGNLSIESADGRVTVSEISGKAPNIDVHTDDGDVRLSFVAGSSYEFIVRTDDGPIRIDVGEVIGLRKSEGRVQGTVGSGKGEVRVRTSDGRVTLAGENLKAS